MRKTGYLLLSLILAGTLMTGCQKKAAVGEENGAAEAGSEADGKELSGAPQISFEKEEKDWYSEDGTQWLIHLSQQDIRVEGEGFETAAEAIEGWQEERELTGYAEGYLEAAEEQMEFEVQDYTDQYLYSVMRSFETARADRKIISLVELDSEYTGGAHGNYGYTGYTFDALSGRLLSLSDVVSDMAAFQTAAAEETLRRLQETCGDELFEDYRDTVESAFRNEEELNWYLNGTGMVVIFNPYSVGPYALGAVRVTLPYQDFAEYFSEACGIQEGAGTAALTEGETASVWTAGSEELLQMRVYLDSDNEYGDGPLVIELGDEKITEDSFSRLSDLFLIHREDGSCFLLLSADYASEDFNMFVYEISGGKLIKTDEVLNCYVGREGSVNTETLRMYKHVNVLGSYSAEMEYVIDKNGKLQQQDELFRIDSDNYRFHILTAKQEVPVRTEGKDGVLPAGSEIRITGTDDQGTALYENIKTGETGEIRYTMGEGEDTWTHYIGGVSEYELFDSIPYAG